MSEATYRELGRRAAMGAAAGVIVDATFNRCADRDAFRSAVPADVPLLVVECQAPVMLLLSLARAREKNEDPSRVSDAGPDVVARQLRECDPLDEIPAAAHVPLRTDRPVAALVTDVADVLDRRAGGGAG